MKEQYIALLSKQIEKLENEDFDLEAWKTSAITVLHRIFGETDPRAKHIDQLKIDYSSWALRDSNAKYKPVETAKRKGKEILQTAIEEIDLFGAPDSQEIASQKILPAELQGLSDKGRKKHFSSMKKDQLIDLLLKLTA